MGANTFEFQREFAKYVGAQDAMAVPARTAELHLALEVAGVREGDEVLLPTTTFTPTGEAVKYLRLSSRRILKASATPDC